MARGWPEYAILVLGRSTCKFGPESFMPGPPRSADGPCVSGVGHTPLDQPAQEQMKGADAKGRIGFDPTFVTTGMHSALAPSQKLCWGKTRHLPHARPAIFETLLAASDLLAPVPSVLRGAPSLRLPSSSIRLNRSRPTLVFSLQLSIFTHPLTLPNINCYCIS